MLTMFQVYWFGPILGGLAGALIYDFVFSSGASLARVRKCMLANEPPSSKIVRGTEAGSTTEQQSLRAHQKSLLMILRHKGPGHQLGLARNIAFPVQEITNKE